MYLKRADRATISSTLWISQNEQDELREIAAQMGFQSVADFQRAAINAFVGRTVLKPRNNNNHRKGGENVD